MNVERFHNNASGQPPLRNALESQGWTAQVVKDAADLVGGIDALEQLDDAPHAPTPFDWSLVAADDREVVESVIAEIGARAEGLLDEQYLGIVHRLIERVASNTSTTLHRGEAVRTAAAFVWLALQGNGHFARFRWETADRVWALFGVRSCAARGRSLFKAAGLTAPPQLVSANHFLGVTDVWLCDVKLFHSQTRTRLITHRSMIVRVLEDDRARRDAARPIQALDDGRLLIRAKPVTPRWATRTTTEVGRDVVLVAIGDSESDVEVLALSIPDARHCVTMLETALDGPRPARIR